ncbi:S-layer homology domain-containing protein [Paenibacillus hamazuiensis]|uniref:CAP and S-layer homology domain-containing protein n=1 Tax=Paenibacillus hamazuiensis TaxID=2936508 RepID=UPI00200DFC69|nr:S-layer homology domain-containing protein [Paenibacillus hamazuiensis]
MRKTRWMTIKFMLAAAVFCILFQSAVPHTFAQELPDPYKNKDMTELRKVQQEGLDKINALRKDMGLSEVRLNEQLSRSAQSHSNYIELNKIGYVCHREDEGHEGYTAKWGYDRNKLFGYSNPTSEGVTYGKISSVTEGIDNLFTSPYHRLSFIRPDLSEVGVGFTLNGSTVIEFGYPSYNSTLSDSQIYPYDNQRNVQPYWQDIELPDPLISYKLPYMSYVGYPITINTGNSATMDFKSAKITNTNGQDVPYYIADRTTNPGYGNNFVFLLPKTPLEMNTSYKVEFKATYQSGGVEKTLDKSWTFTTGSQIVPQKKLEYQSRKASEWAIPELAMADNKGLVPKAVTFNNAITREQFSTVMTKLYETLTGKTDLETADNPFTDTKNSDVLKAYKLGIVEGTSSEKFSPMNPVTREQIAVMLKRTLSAAGRDLKTTSRTFTDFSDDALISQWAKEAIASLRAADVVQGDEKNFFNPVQSTTVEQASIIAYRTLSSVK